VSEERPISGWSKFKKEMEDGVENWTLHDLRRTFATDLSRTEGYASGEGRGFCH
jgi:integrase